MYFKGNETIYSQIAEKIKKKIFSGEYPCGARLPAIRDLAVACQVNPNTVVRVYQQLSEEELVMLSEGFSQSAGIKRQFKQKGLSYKVIHYTSQMYTLERFVEKPDLDTAKEYVASEQYLWNSGMFIWKVSTILENLKEHLPQIYAGQLEIQETIGTESEQQVLEQGRI